ncbi:zinc finger protein [Aphelenchoides avenae]|nr:zinc finger protein [Aphelenchus avenae]
MSSEAWDYFEKSADNVVHCKLCRSDVPIDARNGSPTTSLWVHLENYHLNDYERTEHFRSRVADQSDPESEADRKSTSSSNRSPSTAATVGPNSGSTTVSEVWNYFSKTDAKTVKCSACEFTVTHENVSRQSTAPLWRHLERKHNEEFLKTEFYRIRKRKRVREPAYALDV